MFPLVRRARFTDGENDHCRERLRGPTAAIYAARANLSRLVLEGPQPRWATLHDALMENYPGFPDGIDGPGLILNIHRQAEKTASPCRIPHDRIWGMVA